MDKELELQYVEAYTQLNMLTAKVNLMKQQIKDAVGDENWDGEYIKLRHVERKGTIDYKQIPAVMSMDDSALDQFRRKPSKSTVITVKTSTSD